MRGIVFNNKDSIKDFGLYVKTLDISPPSKKQIRVSVPFLNGSYNFSTLYGENTFEDRQLMYCFDVIGNGSTGLNGLKINVYNWLMGVGECELRDTSIPGYYFLAECINITEDDEDDYSLLQVTFNAYPFKIKEDYEGDNLWDTFCFETDYLQSTSFDVDGLTEIELVNPGIISSIPLIITSAEMEITTQNVTYSLKTGENKINSLKLSPGVNTIIVKGIGNIEIKFKSEVL